MPKITYVCPDGSRRQVQVAPGATLMRAARENNVAGILGECGGACCCATCHVYVDEPWLPLLPGPGELEEELLGFTAAARKPTSRLCCQITASDDLDGLVVFIAPSQH